MQRQRKKAWQSLSIGSPTRSFRHHFPICSGAETLNDVYHASVAANEDALFAPLDAFQDAGGSSLRRGWSYFLKVGHCCLALAFGGVRSQSGALRNRGMYSAGVNTRNRDRSPFKFVSHGFGESAHGKFAGGIRALPRRSNDPEYARQIHNLRARLLLQDWQEILHAMNDAPKIDSQEPAQVIERDFLESAVKGDARVVDEQRYAAVARDNVFGEGFHGRFIGDIQDVRGKRSLLASQRSRSLC